ncbi:hypothetical protein GCM10008983_13380 [Lentibacillus halophilus]|uniref:DUF3221 domain-containing protein n=1 Tax=Lentibacillus halophilus TaxID=295065 RepID=A0ABN0Z7S0_9BACI
MKKLSLLVLTSIFSLAMVGCTNDADFQGVIIKVKESSMIVGTDDVDPEASYPEYEVLVDDETSFKGAVDEFSYLNADQQVTIWVNGEWKNDPDTKMVANKITVSEE